MYKISKYFLIMILCLSFTMPTSVWAGALSPEDTGGAGETLEHAHNYVYGVCAICGGLEDGYVFQKDYETEEAVSIDPYWSSVSGTTSVYNITFYYDQVAARSMLSLVNDFRTGSDAWYWASNDTDKVTCSGLSGLTYDYKGAGLQYPQQIRSL